VLVATPGRLYVFLGGPGLQGAVSGYSSRSLGAQSHLQSVEHADRHDIHQLSWVKPFLHMHE
jgi:hypothetical protein